MTDPPAAQPLFTLKDAEAAAPYVYWSLLGLTVAVIVVAFFWPVRRDPRPATLLQSLLLTLTGGRLKQPTREVTSTGVFRSAYFALDRRTLGFTRILLGWLLLMDLLRRTADWNDMFSNVGVLPNDVGLARPQARGSLSIVLAFSTAPELVVLWLVIFFTFVCVLVGYKTKVFQVLSLLFVTSMNGRVLLIENGGYVVYNLLLLWTCFLPLGDRFSVDSMLASMRRTREKTAGELNDRSNVTEPWRLEPFVSFVGLVIVMQLAAIYYFNVIHKWGPGWRKDWTAVHYVMYVDRMVSPLIGHTREYVPPFVFKLLTRSVIFCEAALPFFLLMPLARPWAKRVAVAMIAFLHVGFGSTFVLGPFAWALCVFSTLLFGYEDWDLGRRTMRREANARVVLFDPASPAALLACRILKRLDHFDLLYFEASPGVRGGVAVETTIGVTTYALAAAEIVQALPLGPCVAWLYRAPGIRQLIDVLWQALERGQPSRFLGLARPAPPPASDRSDLRIRGLRAVAGVREIMVGVMFVGAVNQGATELWCIRDWYKAKYNVPVPQPEYTHVLAHKMRFLQGWFMFSPNPVMDDGTIVVDALTVDGRHIDPFWSEPPNFDLLNAKSFGYNQIWSDYFNRIKDNKTFRQEMIDYMHRLPDRTGDPNDELASGEVYWISDFNPKFGTTSSFGYQKKLLFKFGKRQQKLQN